MTLYSFNQIIAVCMFPKRQLCYDGIKVKLARNVGNSVQLLSVFLSPFSLACQICLIKKHYTVVIVKMHLSVSKVQWNNALAGILWNSQCNHSSDAPCLFRPGLCHNPGHLYFISNLRRGHGMNAFLVVLKAVPFTSEPNIFFYPSGRRCHEN